MKSFSTFQEDLRNWFNPNHPDGDWKRVNTKGEVVGDCAREPGEPKPKCMSKSQRASLSKKEKANAVRRKRKADPNPERHGEPINVTSKVNENMEQLDEKNKPTNPELWARAIAQAKSKFDVYPSAYANGWASKWYKEHGGDWKTVSEAKKLSSFISSIKYAKLDPEHDKGPKGSTDDEEHGAIGEIEWQQQLDHAKKRAMMTTEAKEKTEYDYEGDMARGQLQSIISNAQRVHDMLEDNDNIAEWVQSKITLAEDYISTVANYMMSEVDEAVVIKTNKPIGFRVSDVGAGGKEYNVKTDKAYDDAQAKKKLPQGADFAAQRRKERLASNGRMDEEMQVGDKVNFDHPMKAIPGKTMKKVGTIHKVEGDTIHVKVKDKYGVITHKKTASELRKEEVEQVDELSSDLLGRYKTGASKQASELDKAGNTKKADSRFSGIVKATKKQFNNDLKKESVMEMDKSQTPPGRDGPPRPGPDKEAKTIPAKKFKNHALSILQKSLQAKDKKKDVKEASSPAQQAAIAIAMKKDGKKPMNETLEEGRPSQRHPLEGHDYHKKTDAELVYIAKDAHKAADAMKSHNTDAENKYRDQANDSATVRYFRQKNGMPDWYKKKYGHVKESIEVLDGEEVQASEIIDNIQESRKKAIVREALKDAKDRMEKKGKKEEKKDAMGGKGDKFEAEPQMTSLVNDKQ
jgi:hypothetical protein